MRQLNAQLPSGEKPLGTNFKFKTLRRSFIAQDGRLESIYTQMCRSMEGLEMERITAETHLATVAVCRCVSSGLKVAVKMYHRARLAPKIEAQVTGCQAQST